MRTMRKVLKCADLMNRYYFAPGALETLALVSGMIGPSIRELIIIRNRFKINNSNNDPSGYVKTNHRVYGP